MPALYVAALYAAARLVASMGNVRQAVVIDILALNWLLCELVNISVGYSQVIAGYIIIDVACAMFLSLRVKGMVAGIAEIFFIAMILFNAAYFFRHAFDATTHWAGLSILSWGQLIFVTGGMMRGELRKIMDHLATRLGLQRYLALGGREDPE